MTRSSYVMGYVQPNGQSAQRLSAGMYSLSARSNVPFVRLVGKSVDKTFTWGEIVEVPQGELCGISNASFHAGDIFINGGCDYDNKPARITVPVPYALTLPLLGSWGPGYPADVRMARRAYVCFDATTDLVLGSNASVVGVRIDGSHNTSNQNPAVSEYPGSGYNDAYFISAGELIGMFPLGHLCVLGDDTRPHALLTIAAAFFESNVVVNGVAPPATTPNAYYVMEY